MEKNKTSDAIVELPRWVHNLLKSEAAKGLVRSQLAYSAAVLSFSELPPEEKVKYLHKAQAASYNDGKIVKTA